MTRNCFGTKEFSRFSSTCNACPDLEKCKEVKLYTKDAAYLYFRRVLERKRIRIVSGSPTQSCRHYFVETSNQNFYCLYKRDFFHSFNAQFPEYASKPGVIAGAGESINKEALDFAVKNKCLLIFIYQNEKIYCVDAFEVKHFCEGNGLVRTQDRTNVEVLPNYGQEKQAVNEVTYSFPMKLMQNYLNKEDR